ncbi:MAG TPA: Ig-like domain-containing protein [Polyangia bacterium]|jgi:hypothetical protein|nr:Ig-like domain-containing protein [Polyangia bacterium]
MYDPQPGASGFAVTGSTPANGTTGVLLGAPVIVNFNDYPDPATTAAPAVVLRSTGASPVEIAADARVDLIDKTLIVVPQAALDATTSYELTLTTALASLGKKQLANDVKISFSTGQTGGGELPPPPPRTLSGDVQPIWNDATDGCARPGCHDAATASAGLALDANDAARDLIGAPAGEVDLDRVRPGDPASSYLLRKLLGTPDIVGGRMPIGRVLPPAEIRLISDWILGGAQP